MADGRHHTHIEIEGDHEVEVRVNQADGRWFRMFHALVESGLWAQLSLAAKAVYVVLAKHADDTWLTWPSVPKIAELAGLKTAGTYKGVAELEKRKLLVRQRAYRRKAMYRLVEPVGEFGSFHHGGIPPRWNSTAVESDPISGTRLKSSSRSAKRRSAERRGAQAGAPTGSAAAAGFDQDVMVALVDAGISEPTRSQLANTPHITAKMVRRVADRAKERGKGAGAVVLDLRAASEKAARDAERKRQQREQARAEQVAIETQRQHEHAEALGGEDRQQALEAGWRALGRSRMT